MKCFSRITLVPLLAAFLLSGTALAAGKQDQVDVQVSAERLSSEQITRLQRALKEHGVDPGPVDGTMGRLTQQAIQLFQRQEGLATTGDLNERTLEALDLEAQEFLGISPAFEREQQGEAGGEAVEPSLQVSLEQLNSAQVLKLQQQLQKEGIDPGPVDGVMGPLTKQGIQVLQQQEGLAVTGDLNARTLEALDIEAEEFMGLAPEFE